MLNVFTGRFPDLESTLVVRIRRAKADDPFAPLALLVPSGTLGERLRRLLAVEHRLSLLNVHLLTFHQLALRLAGEVREQRGAEPVLDVCDDLLFEQLIRHIVRSRLSTVVPLQHIGHSSGTWTALWSTVRDLKDAGVDPGAALRAVEEACFGGEDRDWLRALFSLHAAVMEAGKTLLVGTPDDLAASMTPFVGRSRFISGLRQVFYYGFYDLTQVQLSLFEAVSKAAPTTVFFPLDDHPSFRFARRFFDRSIPLLRSEPDQRAVASETAARRPPSLTVRSVVGTEEELASTCRHILDLVETNGYRFDEIGVVARTLDPYRASLAGTFERHRIPLVTAVGRPLIEEPLCKTLLQLAMLPLHEYYRATMLDVVTSPLYRSTRIERAAADQVRPDLWKLIPSALHITRGKREWARLEGAGRAALSIDGGEEEYRIGPLTVPPQTIRLLAEIVTELLADLDSLPARGSASQLVGAFQDLFARRVHHPDAEDEHGSRPGRIYEELDGVWRTLAQLDMIGDDITWAEFVELLTHLLERTAVPLEPAEHCGVAVMDVMAARGLSFKALFVLGLNEKVFPRYIREDPFLRDRHRRVLDETLGFKIDEKLAGYDEEALLLALLCQSTDRLVLSYQRADEQGRALTASPYLGEAARLCRVEDPPIEAVPRRLTDRLATRPTVAAFLPPADLALALALQAGDAASFLEAVGGDASSLRHGLDALRHIEDERPRLTPCDGLTGPLGDQWSRMLERGLAPTPLERYAHCPFQYFAVDVLRLEPVRRALPAEVDAALAGTVCHAALRRCYEQLLTMGWPVKPVTDDTVEWCVYNAVEQAAAEHEARHRTGHYLLWELAKEQFVELVAAAVDADEAAQADDPSIPVAFEVEAEGLLPWEAEGGRPLKIHGRVDRIDRRPHSDHLRIIDYKFKIGSAGKPEDRNLLQAAVRGLRLQPPVYACLDIPGHPKPAQVQLCFLAPRWPTPVVRSTFESSLWSTDQGLRIRETITAIVDGIGAGRFFILPDGYCDACDYRVSCRRDHTPTWWRAYRASEPKQLRSFRTRTVKDE